MSFESFPLNIGWELTLKCNLRCNHCASAAGIPRADELTTEEALKICDQFPDLLVQEVDFTGGEPLLRSDWVEIAAHLRELGIATNILSNCLILDQATVSKLKQADISTVGTSLDGLEKTHDHIRGCVGSFAKVIRGIELLHNEGIQVIVITTVNAVNISELKGILDLLESLGVDSWRLQPLIPVGRANSFREMEMDESDLLSLGDFIKNWTPKAKTKGLKIICSDGLEYIDETWPQERPWLGCPAGWTTCGITSDGKIKGCLSLPDEIVEGDLRKNDLWDIWFNPKSFSYSRHFSHDQLGSNCDSCLKADECLGGCSSNSYAATGKFHNDPYCYYKIKKTRESTKR